MKVSRNSWHYKMLFVAKANSIEYRHLDYTKASLERVAIPLNLCPYFWQVMRVLASKVVFSVFLVLGVLGVLALVVEGIMAIYLWVQTGFPFSIFYAENVPSLTLFLLAAIGTGLGVYALLGTVQDTLGGAYVKAKINRVCPSITFVGMAHFKQGEDDAE